MSRGRNKELELRLLPNEHVIDMVPLPESKEVRMSCPLFFDEETAAASYFFSFLDLRSLASYTFINKTTLKIVGDIAEELPLPERTVFYAGLRDIAFELDFISQVDECKKSLENETKETLGVKLKRHCAWAGSWIGGQIAVYTPLIVKIRSYTDEFFPLVNKGIGLFETIYKAGNFFDHDVSGKLERGDVCVDGSSGWKACIALSPITEVCQNAFAACKELPDVLEKIDKIRAVASPYAVSLSFLVAAGGGRSRVSSNA